MKLGIANDHAAVDMKMELMDYLKQQGHEVVNYGTDTNDSCNYPEFGEKLGRAIMDGEVERGIAICGTGIGISLAANKIRGIRAACVSEPVSARFAMEHNNANVIAFGARIVGMEEAKAILNAYLGAQHLGGRHAGRVQMIMDIEDHNL